MHFRRIRCAFLASFHFCPTGPCKKGRKEYKMSPQSDQDREMKPAIWKGMRHKCPKCGEGALFQKYLKVVDTCDHCGQELHHHRADDGPAYLTILVVAHLVGFALHFAFVAFRPEPWLMASVGVALSVGLALWMLPRMKGLVVAIQWAKRMHGFGTTA